MEHRTSTTQRIVKLEWIKTMIASMLFWLAFMGYSQDAIDKPTTNTPYVSITNTEQMIWFVNAQQLVNKWNNIIIHAKTGAEQLKIMDESGVFAKDVQLTFDFGNGQVIKTTGLTKEPLPFYSQFVDSLQKKRFNIAANVDVVAFGADYLRFNFKHSIFMDETLSLIGENQVIMRRDGDRFFVTAAYIKIILNNTQHAY